jgi:F-type H+-transporting ATPase subunit b
VKAFRVSAGFRRCATFLFAFVLLAPVAPRLPAQATSPAQPQAPANAGENSTPVATVPEKNQEVRDENAEYRHSPAVVKLGSIIGLNAEQAATAFTVFNFLVLVVAVGYVMLKTLPKTFRNRSSAIQKRLVDARTATEEATARLNSVEARLSKLDSQIAAMRKQAEADSARDERRILAGVEEEKQKILAAADAEISAATTAARRDIQEYAASLAIEQAARKLVVSAETDRLLIQGFAHRLGADKGESN